MIGVDMGSDERGGGLQQGRITGDGWRAITILPADMRLHPQCAVPEGEIERGRKARAASVPGARVERIRPDRQRVT